MPQKNTRGWNPIFRNKKIGTAHQGAKPRNDFGIPSSWHDDRVFWERLQNPTAQTFSIDDHDFTVLIEPTLEDFKHYVSVTDLIEVIKHIPIAHRRDIKVFALRQPKRKEFLHNQVWGRLGYWADFGQYSGVSVLIEAQPVNLAYKLDKKISTDFARELDLLRQEGHAIHATKRRYEVSCPPMAIRNTQLFRTLLHEIGHYVDYISKVLSPAEQGLTDEASLQEIYHSRPTKEREAFAERYAQDAIAVLRNKGIVPFEPMPMSPELLAKLDPNWFYAP